MNDPVPAILPRQSGSKAVNPFRLLIWLKWTLLWRAYTRQRLKIVGAIVLVICFAPISIGAAYLCFAFGNDNPAFAPILMTAVLSIAYALWLITPLLGFPLNESYDPTRLFVYPVPLSTIFAAMVAGSFLELTTMLAMPVFIVMVLIFSSSFIAAIVALAAVVLFLMHTFAMAQLFMLSLIGFLRSRRFRDITIVVFPLIAMTFYVAQQAAVRRIVEFNPFDMLSWPIWRIADYLPPGWASQATSAARDGDLGRAALFLALLAVGTIIPISIAANVLKNMYLGDRGPSIGRSSAAAAAPSPARVPDASPQVVAREGAHSEIAALARKERIYLLREPQYKALGVNTLYTIIVMFFALSRGGGGFSAPANAPSSSMGGFDFSMIFTALRAFTLPTILLLATLPLSFNIFGGDASAITVLLSFPTPRRKLILAKNLAYTPVIIGLSAIGALAASVFLHSTALLPITLVWVLLATPVIVGAGNLVSVRFPRKLLVRGQRWGRGGQASFGTGAAGCGYGLIYLLSYMGSFVILAPVAAAIIIPLLFNNTSILEITIPVATLYSALIYLAATNLAAGMMVRREAEMVSSLAPDE